MTPVNLDHPQSDAVSTRVRDPRSPIKKVRLQSDPFPEVRFRTVVRITVGPDGAIDDLPKKFVAGQKGRDFVTWEITNASGQPIAVTVSDFLRRAKHSDDVGRLVVNPFVWLNSDTVTLQDGEEGFIDGRINAAYERHDRVFDSLSYSIIVESRATTGAFETIDYDPDGDIKP